MNFKPNEYRLRSWILVSTILLLCLGVDAHAQIKVAPDNEAAKILTVVETKPDPKIPIEPLTGLPGTSTLVRNPAKTYRAFVLCIPAETAGSSCSARVFFTDDQTKKTFMVTGEPDGVEGARPIDELKWIDNERLSYERWMSPHYGHRYVLNVRSKKQVAAFIVADQVK